MTFAELPVGAYFRFFEGGSILRKDDHNHYSAPQWGRSHTNLVAYDRDQEVLLPGSVEMRDAQT